MAEYIEREAALEEIENADVMCDIPADAYRVLRRYIESIPAADVVPVRHGHWEADEYRKYYRWYCSCCLEYRDEQTPFCPSCGAKMD